MLEAILALFVIAVFILILWTCLKIFWNSMKRLKTVLIAIREKIQAVGEGESLDFGMVPHFDDGLPPEKEIEILSEKISGDPDNFDLYYQRGFQYETIDDYGNAVKDFSRCIELNPGFVDAYFSRGYIYLECKDYDSSLMDFNRGVEMEPGKWKGYNYRGKLLFRTGDFDGAANDFTRSINLMEDNPFTNTLYHERAMGHFCRGDYENALYDINKSLNLSDYLVPSDDIYLMIFILQNRLGRDGTDELQVHKSRLSRDILTSPFDSTWILKLMKLYLGDIDISGCLEEMNRDREEIKQKEYLESVMPFYIGEWYLMNNDNEKAKEYFEMCITKGQGNQNEIYLAKAELNRL